MNYQEIRAGIEPANDNRRLQQMVRFFRFLLGFLLAAGMVVAFHPSGDERTALGLKVDALKLERDALKAERDAQVRKMGWIKDDVRYLEIAARDRLGLQKDGEFIIRFQTAEPGAAGTK